MLSQFQGFLFLARLFGGPGDKRQLFAGSTRFVFLLDGEAALFDQTLGFRDLTRLFLGQTLGFFFGEPLLFGDARLLRGDTLGLFHGEPGLFGDACFLDQAAGLGDASLFSLAFSLADGLCLQIHLKLRQTNFLGYTGFFGDTQLFLGPETFDLGDAAFFLGSQAPLLGDTALFTKPPLLDPGRQLTLALLLGELLGAFGGFQGGQL